MEIGSEFWGVPIQDNEEISLPKGLQYVLSGRTALELTARDLIKERGIRSVCLPAYCCDSMITPFRCLGLEVCFYEVRPSGEGLRRFLEEDHGCDAVLLMDYFGFSQTETKDLAEREHALGRSVILDCVQSLFSEGGAEIYADYRVMSWRKWFFSCAGAAVKRTGEWKVRPHKPPLEEYVRLRKEGAERKSAWLFKGIGDKQSFLNAYVGAEELLDTDFAGYEADPESLSGLRHLDSSFIRDRRRENAGFLYRELADMDRERIRPLFGEPGEGDVPLFVPVLVKDSLRDPLRRFLIGNQIYCPVHWPDAGTGGGKELYAGELSLLCDQRYKREDMQRQINTIKEFFDQHG